MATRIRGVVVRQPYNYDADQASNDSALLFTEPTLAQQQFKDDCDVNVIVSRFVKTGQLPQVTAQAMYGDFLDAPQSYQDALNAVINAQDGFDELPAKLRERFQNDPYELLKFVSDAKNRDEAVSLGLIEKAPPAPSEGVPEPSPVPPATPASPA